MLRKLTAIATINLLKTSLFQLQLHRHPFLSSFPTFSTLKPQQVLQQLSKVVTEEEFETVLIEISKLNSINKRLCIEKIISRIKQNTLPPYTVVNEKFVTHLKKFPDLHIKTLLHRVNQQLGELSKMVRRGQEEGKKIAVKDINTCYSTVFDILKKMPRTEAAELEVKVYKSFADYHHSYLSNMVELNRVKEVLKKSCDFYRSALSKVVALIEKQDERARILPKEKVEIGDVDINTLTEEKIKELEGSVELRRFKFVEQYCDVLYKILNIQNYITDPRIKDHIRPRTKLEIPFMYHEGLYSLIPSFEKGLSFFKEPSDKVESSFFYKIKKTFLELQHSQCLEKCKDNPQAIQRQLQDFDKKMQELTKQIIIDIQLTPLLKQTVEIYRNLSIILLSIKSNKLARSNITEEEFQERLVQEIKSILAIFRNKDLEKVISASIIGVVETVMKLNIQKHLGRLPRSTRCKSRKKLV